MINSGQLLRQRYEIQSTLGRGVFGAAYLANDIEQDRVCVIKQIFLPQGITTQQTENVLPDFKRNVETLEQLNRPGHPGIPKLYDYFSETDANYLVLQYIQGQSLGEVLKNKGRLPWLEAVCHIIGVCKILNYVHTHDETPIIFRDVKADNIWLDENEKTWLLDYGLAIPVNSVHNSEEKTAIGSLGFTPLEQWLGEEVLASDIYATGATLHYLVTGLRPSHAYNLQFNLQKIKELHGKFSSVRNANWRIPKRLDEIIANATAVEPDKRPNAHELQQQLEALVAEEQQKSHQGRLTKLTEMFKLRMGL